jgi:hypothetical protein
MFQETRSSFNQLHVTLYANDDNERNVVMTDIDTITFEGPWVILKRKHQRMAYNNKHVSYEIVSNEEVKRGESTQAQA